MTDPQVTEIILRTGDDVLTVIINIAWEYLLFVSLQHLHILPSVGIPQPSNAIIPSSQDQGSLRVKPNTCYFPCVSFC